MHRCQVGDEEVELSMQELPGEEDKIIEQCIEV